MGKEAPIFCLSIAFCCLLFLLTLDPLAFVIVTSDMYLHEFFFIDYSLVGFASLVFFKFPFPTFLIISPRNFNWLVLIVTERLLLVHIFYKKLSVDCIYQKFLSTNSERKDTYVCGFFFSWKILTWLYVPDISDCKDTLAYGPYILKRTCSHVLFIIFSGISRNKMNLCIFNILLQMWEIDQHSLPYRWLDITKQFRAIFFVSDNIFQDIFRSS